ncbi:Uu.00g076300.m01.CDS01 [Anthostomella pinea]|uniref:RNA-dependent RNA polymerase n=1 Tax=Anthostomella pinea TaxID=933095 RepID=A0AAI8YP96_9PEZI|nr:Uu.00g076300.m01.CDS01 [Anthostomella pinea]
MAGMLVFMSNLPPKMTEEGLRIQLLPLITEHGVHDWSCQKPKGKNIGFLSFLRRREGEWFLASYGEQIIPGAIGPDGKQRSRSRLKLLRMSVFCKQSDKPLDPFLYKTLVKAAEDRAHEDENEQEPQKHTVVTFEMRSLSCGHFEYLRDHLAYTADIEWNQQGIAKFARDALIVSFDIQSGPFRVEMPYRIIHDITTCTRPSSLVLTLLEAPRFFGPISDQGIAGIMAQLGLTDSPQPASDTTRTRLSHIPHHTDHRDIMGQCLAYRIELSAADFHLKVKKLKEKDHLNFTYYNFTYYPHGRTYMVDGLQDFRGMINLCSKSIPFDVLFQLQALVQNGYLLPQTVVSILARLHKSSKHTLGAAVNHGVSIGHRVSARTNGTSSISDCNDSNGVGCPGLFSASAVRKIFAQIAFPGPDTKACLFDPNEIWTWLEANEKEVQEGITRPLITERARENRTMIHKVHVTPSRIILLGPEAEAKNRILRKFSHHTGYFARVQFCDEDGQDLFYNPKVSLSEVYDRYKQVLLTGIPIAGRVYQFLGFSHSSLRARAVWFMAPFVDHNGQSQTYHSVIVDLGRFQNIFCPARCAARIGQAFSETPFSVDLDQLGAHVYLLPDVKSADGARVFSDGVGTISRDLMEAIQEAIPHRAGSATCFQIRWAGAKGMLSLDDTLEGMVMRVRSSMIKFESDDKQNLEICDVANKPVPLVLNRQIIKIMEDMGVPDAWFLKAQSRELARLCKITGNVDNTVIFLKRQMIADQMRFFQFIRRLHKLGIDYKKDRFLCSIVETVILREVRLLKHKARIPIEKGVTLFGVMDEFGYLGEDEVYITYGHSDGAPHHRDLHDRLVILTRSPALHPGDVQIRRAIVPPDGHPLRSLTNCIVFSQKGERDLPSQLSGGDLDGDKFHVIYDDVAVEGSKREFKPADYPRVSLLDVGREVTREDMTDFFVNFMSTDQLGVIATRHQILSDMHAAGTLHEGSQMLAEMHSMAVDYSKTGIAVPMSKLDNPPPPLPVSASIDPQTANYTPDSNIFADLIASMAPSPTANIIDRTEIQFEAPVAPATDYDEDDDTGPKYKYYKSEKILGKLYRAIDEKKTWKNDIHLTVNQYDASVWDGVLLYTNRKCEELGGVDWKSALKEARSIRQAYDDQIWNATFEFSEHSSMGLTELEVFTGSIFNKSGKQTPRQRDKSTQLKDEFDRISKWAEDLIRKQGDKPPGDYNDDDTEDEDDAYQGSSPLELSIACLHVGVERATFEPGSNRRGGGDFQSFKIVAAHCALRELEHAIKQGEIAAGVAVMGGGFPGVNAGRS